MAPLRHHGLVEDWHDGRIHPGEPWEQAIFDQLDAADVILLLISARFLNSYYCYERELSRALKRHEAGQARVVPVIVRPCLWEGHPQFGHLQVLPERGKAITEWDNRDQAYTGIVSHHNFLS